MWIMIAILIILIVWLLEKYLSYYFSTLGLLYYLATKHNDLLELEEVRELQQKAIKKTVDDWFKK